MATTDGERPARDRIVMPGHESVVRRLRESPSALAPLAIAVGAITGVGAIVFRWLITEFTRAFTGSDNYAGLGRVANGHWPALGFWFVLLTPVIACAIYGPLVHRFAPEARGHGMPEVMYAVAERGGRIAPQVTVVKALASALCTGGSGSVGREGPIVQVGSAAGPRSPGCCGWRPAESDCLSPVAPPVVSPRRSTPRWPGRSLRWN